MGSVDGDSEGLQAEARRAEVIKWLGALIPEYRLPFYSSDEELREMLGNGTPIRHAFARSVGKGLSSLAPLSSPISIEQRREPGGRIAQPARRSPCPDHIPAHGIGRATTFAIRVSVRRNVGLALVLIHGFGANRCISYTHILLSAMHIIKSDLPNRIRDDWVNDLMICYVEKEIFAKK